MLLRTYSLWTSCCHDLGYSANRKHSDCCANFRGRYHKLQPLLAVSRPDKPKPRHTLNLAKKLVTDSQPATKEPDMAEISSISRQSLLTGQLCLCGVALLWGSYSPVIRYIYSSPGPPTPAALTAVRTVIQAFVLLISDAAVRQQQFSSPDKAKARQPVASPNVSRNYDQHPAIMGSILSWLSRTLQSTSSKLWIAGAELGFWNFCGSTFQALGLQYTTATRGAFLIQVSKRPPLLSGSQGQQAQAV